MFDVPCGEGSKVRIALTLWVCCQKIINVKCKKKKSLGIKKLAKGTTNQAGMLKSQPSISKHLSYTQNAFVSILHPSAKNKLCSKSAEVLQECYLFIIFLFWCLCLCQAFSSLLLSRLAKMKRLPSIFHTVTYHIFSTVWAKDAVPV